MKTPEQQAYLNKLRNSEIITTKFIDLTSILMETEILRKYIDSRDWDRADAQLDSIQSQLLQLRLES